LDLWQLSLRSSEPAEQDQDQHDNENETEAAATVITGAVERSAAEAAKAPEQYDDQNDEQDGSNRHRHDLRSQVVHMSDLPSGIDVSRSMSGIGLYAMAVDVSRNGKQ